MDISKLDEQVVDIVTAWVNSYRSGHNLPSSFDYGYSILAEPAATTASHMASAIRDVVIEHRPVSAAFHDLLQSPSQNLTLMVETFLNSWQSPTGIDVDIMKALIDRLWDTPATQAAIMHDDQIKQALHAYYFDPNHNTRIEMQKSLLSLGDHLIPYLDGAITLGIPHSDVAAFLLLKRLGTDAVVKNLRRYAAQTYIHYPIASVVLDELGLSYHRPQNANSSLYCWECRKALSNMEPIFRTDLHGRAIFCSSDHLKHGIPHLSEWT